MLEATAPAQTYVSTRLFTQSTAATENMLRLAKLGLGSTLAAMGLTLVSMNTSSEQV
jgi:hypothetical protein